MIEKNLHFIWDKGYEAMPEKYKLNVASWKKYHPTWKLYFWDKTSMDELVKTQYPEFIALWNSCNQVYEFVDMFKLIALHFYGGVYVDTDIECLRTYPDNFLEKEFVISKANKDDYCKGDQFSLSVLIMTLGKSTNTFLNNGFYGGKQGSDILYNLVQKIEQTRKTHPTWLGSGFFISGTGGPIFITNECITNKWCDDPRVQILEPHFMEPCGLNYSITKNISDCGITSDTIGIHRHELSWATPFMKKWMKIYYYRNNISIIIIVLCAVLLLYMHNTTKKFGTLYWILVLLLLWCVYVLY